MHKTINLYVSDDCKLSKGSNIHLSKIDEIVAGSIDSLWFSELETIKKEDIGSFISTISEKIKINNGRLFFSFKNTEKIINDICQDRINIDQMNKILFDNAFTKNLFLEKTIVDSINEIKTIMVVNITYDDSLIKMEMVRHA